jgi:hypothetical protein
MNARKRLKLRRKVQPLSLKGCHSLPLGGNLVQVQLRLAGRTVDEVNHEFVVAEHPKVTEADRIFVKDGHFVILVPSPLIPRPRGKALVRFRH